jgi:metallo-beta-lactamase family protein
VEITFYGAAKTVTGSCHLIDTGKTKIMVDCGMFQGSKKIKERNYGDFPFDPTQIEYLLLTHAHIDHSGLIPKLVKHGFKGQIIATGATLDLCSIMLPDSGHIQEMEVERKNRKLKRAGEPLLEPIYTSQDAYKAMKYFKGIDYGLVIALNDNISVRFNDAGHIMGSAIIEIWIKQREQTLKIVFSGDLGNYNQPIINDPVTIDEADFLIMESTYGNRLHKDSGDKEELLFKIIKETFDKGGNVIIPAFAVERTQDLLYSLNNLIEKGKLRDVDIFVDSPLAISATEIFCRNIQYFDKETREKYETLGECPLFLPNLKFTRTTEESKALNERKSGAIIISASGMCDAGRIKHHLKHNLWRSESTILFVGYQAEGTLGRRLVDGEKLVKIHGEEIKVKARIENMDGFSAHSDQKDLIRWVKKFRTPPQKIFLVHGEEESCYYLANELTKETGIPTIVPEYLQSFIIQDNLDVIISKLQEGLAQRITAGEVKGYYKDILDKLQIMVHKYMSNGQYEQALKKLQEIESITAEK